MKPKRALLTSLFLIAVFSLAPGRAFPGSGTFTASVGSARIQFPDIEAFSTAELLPPDTLALISSTVPEVNRLLALYVSDDDVARILNDQPPAFFRYMMVQTSRQYENTFIGGSDFAVLAGSVKSEHETLLSAIKDELKGQYDQVSRSFSRYFETAVELGLENMVPLGVFIDREKAVGFASMARVTTVAGGVRSDRIMVGATSLVNVKGKLLFVYVYSGFTEDGDVEWVKATTARLTDRVLELNR